MTISFTELTTTTRPIFITTELTTKHLTDIFLKINFFWFE